MTAQIAWKRPFELLESDVRSNERTLLWDTTMTVRDFLSTYREKILFFTVTITGAFIDIITKHAVFRALGGVIEDIKDIPTVIGARDIDVIGQTLRFHCTMNTGAVFSIFRGKWIFLVIFTLVSLAIILWIIFKQKKGRPYTVLGLGLVCAGALGNLWDRFLFSGVRDFIDFRTSLLEPLFPGGHWPTFNVADVWICVGIALIFLSDFILHRKDVEPEAPGTPSPENEPANEEEGTPQKRKKKKKKKKKKT